MLPLPAVQDNTKNTRIEGALHTQLEKSIHIIGLISKNFSDSTHQKEDSLSHKPNQEIRKAVQ
jgi:hypothetical protein